MATSLSASNPARSRSAPVAAITAVAVTDAAGLEAGADDDLGGGGPQLLHRLQRDRGALDLAPALRRQRLGRGRNDFAVRAGLVPLDHIAVVGQAGAKEMNQERRRRVAGHHHGCRRGAVSFVPVREDGGRTPSPVRPTAAPLTAGTPLSMERGTPMERVVGRRRSTREPAAPTAEGKFERLDEGAADAADHGGVFACVGPARSVQPGGALDPREVDGVAGACGELLQILELRAPVAVAERVDMVDVAQHRTRTRG